VRIAVLGVGGPAGVNTCRALDAAGHDVIGIDNNELHLAWAEPFCSKTSTLLQDDFDLIHAQPEAEVRWLSGTDLPKLTPMVETVIACQHKPTTAVLWHATGLRRFPPVSVGEPLLESLDYAAEMFGLPFWLRSAVGAGAKCATLVSDVKMGFHWVKYWETREETIEWVAEEYLPLRDYCWTSVWRNGILYASFTRERLEWLYPHLAPSGRTGTPTVAVTVHDSRVNETARQAIWAVDDEPNGIYCVDLREDRDGVPRPTEINAGRWATTSPLYHELGPNLPALHARLAVGEKLLPWGDDIYPAGTQLLRHIDCGHIWRSQPERETDAPHPSRTPAMV
jgi:hypothetical protein